MFCFLLTSPTEFRDEPSLFASISPVSMYVLCASPYCHIGMAIIIAPPTQILSLLIDIFLLPVTPRTADGPYGCERGQRMVIMHS